MALTPLTRYICREDKALRLVAIGAVSLLSNTRFLGVPRPSLLAKDL